LSFGATIGAVEVNGHTVYPALGKPEAKDTRGAVVWKGRRGRIFLQAGSGNDRISVRSTAGLGVQVDITGRHLYTFTPLEASMLIIDVGDGKNEVFIGPGALGSGCQVVIGSADSVSGAAAIPVPKNPGRDAVGSRGHGNRVAGSAGHDRISSQGASNRAHGSSPWERSSDQPFSGKVWQR